MYKAPNRIIQGSSADQVKLAMLNLWRSGDLSPSLLLQVHDELNLSNGKGEKGRALVIDAMENATEALVPFVVDVTIGERWMASK
jgi:DNA polymerase-1